MSSKEGQIINSGKTSGTLQRETKQKAIKMAELVRLRLVSKKSYKEDICYI